MDTETKRTDGRTDKRTTANEHTVGCHACQHRIPQAVAVSIDVSAPDEYYPEFQHYCPGCSPLVSEVA